MKKYRPFIFSFLPFLTLCSFFYFCASTNSSNSLKNKSQFHFRLARNYYSDRNISMALREIHKALTLDPENEEAHHLKGFIYLGLKEYDTAILQFKRAIELKPDYYDAMNNLGSAYIGDGRYQDAIKILSTLISQPLYGTPHLAYGNLGFAYYKLKDYKNAIKYLELSIFRNPRFCLGYRNLGKVYMELGNHSRSIENFEKSIEICPKYIDPYFYLGILFEKEKKYELAKKMFNVCSELSPQSFYGKRCKKRILNYVF